MNFLALKTPGGDNTPEDLPVPPGLPKEVTDGITTTSNVFQLAVNSLLLVGATIAVVMIMISGIRMITSGGDATKLASAKRRMIFSIIGLILILGAFFLVGIVMKVLGINSDLSTLK